jgi:mannose-6-phosphate isomerase-like protein (cupin superfamily)
VLTDHNTFKSDWRRLNRFEWSSKASTTRRRTNPNWRRVSLAGSERFTFEWFEKPPGHSFPMHNQENEQVCIVLGGELTAYTEDDEVTLRENDSVLLEAWKDHRRTDGRRHRRVRTGPRIRLLDRPRVIPTGRRSQDVRESPS